MVQYSATSLIPKISKSSLSVVIVCKNEEKNIKSCLDSVAWAKEIIIVDDESTDKTRDIARQYTPHIYIHAWQGCGQQKKLAVNYATQDWVLILDADERLTPALQQEIIHRLPDTVYNGFYIPFNMFYLKKRIYFGQCWREKHLRLFRKTKGTLIPRKIHFGLTVSGPLGKLKNTIEHDSYPSLEHLLKKMNHYSTAGAELKYESGQTSYFYQALCRAGFSFIRNFIFRLGFLDGKIGFIFAFGNAEETYYRYLKLSYLNNLI